MFLHYNLMHKLPDPLSPSCIKMNEERPLKLPIQNLRQDIDWKSHYEHLINVLLDRANLKTTDGLTSDEELNIKIHRENYNYLTEFPNSKEDDIAVSQNIHSILSEALSKPTSYYTTETTITHNLKNYIYTMFSNTNCLICLSLFFALLLSRQFLKANLSLGSMFKRLIFLGWIIDFCFRWFTLLRVSYF